MDVRGKCARWHTTMRRSRMELLSATQRINEIDNLSFLFYFYFLLLCCSSILPRTVCESFVRRRPQAVHWQQNVRAHHISFATFHFCQTLEFRGSSGLCLIVWLFFFWTSVSAISVAGQMKRKKNVCYARMHTCNRREASNTSLCLALHHLRLQYFFSFIRISFLSILPI